jgi:hypothetical protein
VKPVREKDKRELYRRRWWHYAEKRPGLYSAIRGRFRVMVTSQVSKNRAFVFLPSNFVYDQKLVVFPVDTYAAFCVLQSSVHDIWSRFFGVTLEDRPVYTPSDCFETFPFPKNFQTLETLESPGREYYEYRAELMVKNAEGLTATYNGFHDPDERGLGIMRLREMHSAIDRAVLDSYGWTDIQPICEFLLDYEDQGDTEQEPSRRKKPWRCRWPDEIRDEVLARLLDLNRVRAEEEQLNGEAVSKSRVIAIRKQRQSKKNKARAMGNLLTDVSEEGKS